MEVSLFSGFVSQQMSLAYGFSSDQLGIRVGQIQQVMNHQQGF